MIEICIYDGGVGERKLVSAAYSSNVSKIIEQRITSGSLLVATETNR
jgi:hypothetical protein